MVFSSISFLFIILPLFLLGDLAARTARSVCLRNSVLLAVSLLFYTWGESATVFVLVALSIFNYLAGGILHRGKNPRLILGLSVGVNLAVLIGYKYTFWLVSLIVPGLLTNTINMPLGISFFTFHAISYLIDIFRKTIPPASTPLNFFAYFCMFPHLVAGPIVRYAQVQHDLEQRGPDRNLFAFGVFRFLLGLNKKVLIANFVAQLADAAFEASKTGHLSGYDAWIGISAYAIQIYFDFSGYSDMAIGLAAMAGFHFEENFKRPYSANSIREFWKRWHISLSSWLRDYLYIPLGGSRGGSLTTYRNLLFVFLVCGIWHGADATFVIWGAWHGAFLILERLPAGRVLEILPAILRRCYMALVVLVGWVFFRADNFDSAVVYLSNMFTLRMAPFTFSYFALPLSVLAIGVFLCLIPDRLVPTPTSHKETEYSLAAFYLQAILGIASIGALLTSTHNPFIYFNF